MDLRSGEGPPTTTTSGPQPGVAGNRTQGPQPEIGEIPPTTHTRHTHTNDSRRAQPREAGTSNQRHHRHTTRTRTHTPAHAEDTPRPHQPPHHQHRRHKHTKHTRAGAPRTPSRNRHTLHGKPPTQPKQNQHPPPQQQADPSQEWRGTAIRTLSQEWRGTTHHHNQRTPAKSGGEPHPGPSASNCEAPTTTTTSRPLPGVAGELHRGPSARIGKGRPTTTSSGPQPGMAGNRTEGPQPGVARNHQPPQPAGPSHQWRGTAPKALSQDWRGTTHHHNQRTTGRSRGEPQPAPSAGSGERPPTTTNSGPQPGVAGSRTQDPQPAIARDHPPPQPADPSPERRGTVPGALSQDWRGTTHHYQQRTPARSGGEPHPKPSARRSEGPPSTTTSGLLPGVAGNRTQSPKPGLARDHPLPEPADPSQQWRGTARTAVSQDLRWIIDRDQQQTLARSGGEPHPGPSARNCEGPATTHSRHTHTSTSRTL